MKRIASVMLMLTVIVSVFSFSAFAASGNVSSKEFEENLKQQKSTEQSVSASEDSSISEAYQRVMKEEANIVSLITASSGKATSTSEWKYNLNYLKNNYKAIQKQAKGMKISMNDVDSYIAAYEVVQVIENSPAETVADSTVIKASASYDLNKAVTYATTYWSSYNSSYPDWTEYGGDCANFVSQALYAGGKAWVGTPGTSSEATNFANWFSKGSTNSTTNVSSTWRGADAFRNFWQLNAVAYKKFTSYGTDAYNYGYRGDAVSLLTSTGRAYHTLMIVDYSGTDLVYAAHTSNTKTGSLKTAATNSGNGFIIYNMSF